MTFDSWIAATGLPPAVVFALAALLSASLVAAAAFCLRQTTLSFAITCGSVLAAILIGIASETAEIAGMYDSTDLRATATVAPAEAPGTRAEAPPASRLAQR